MVSIKLVWDGGIIAHAQNAVNSYNEAQTNELEQLNILEEQFKQYGGTNESGNWWEFRTGEAEEFEKNGSQAANGNMIACDSTMENHIIFYDMGHGDLIDGLLVKVTHNNVTEGFICYIGDNTLKAYADEKRERGIWYKFINNNADISKIPYDGVCPISIEDFADGTIYCQSYLERVIASFNN